jgi:glycosyltransferase involved in cell wall biosynthesis
MSTTKLIILTFIGYYLPGYKFGGPLRSISNMVDQLGDEFKFLIITSDHDLGDNEPYSDINPNQWNAIGSAEVYYISPQSCTVKGLAKLITDTPHDILYTNSFFDPIFTIRLMLARKMGWLPIKPVIIAPRGEFEEGSVRLKYLKKFAYIQVARMLGLYKKVTWHASSEYEMLDIIKNMKVNRDAIKIALNLPTKIITDIATDVSVQSVSDSVELKLVFLSRITREKNLDYALRVLKKVNAIVNFDIYGPAEDDGYWKECQKLIDQLPANVMVNYLGSVRPEQVSLVLSRYDLLFFPTSGENYGHVIVESLTAGTPVLISDKTPWCNLQAKGLGWDKDLRKMDSFVEIIEKYSLVPVDIRSKTKNLVKSKIMEILLDSTTLEANRQLFKGKKLGREYFE